MVSGARAPLDAAYATCLRLGRAHDESFCRAVDDAVDEVGGDGAAPLSREARAAAENASRLWAGRNCARVRRADPITPQGRRLKPLVAEFNPPRQPGRRLDRPGSPRYH